MYKTPKKNDCENTIVLQVLTGYVPPMLRLIRIEQKNGKFDNHFNP